MLPRRSNLLGPRVAGIGRSTKAPSSRQANPTGTLNQNTQRQPNEVTSAPPTVGPRSEATEKPAM